MSNLVKDVLQIASKMRNLKLDNSLFVCYYSVEIFHLTLAKFLCHSLTSSVNIILQPKNLNYFL